MQLQQYARHRDQHEANLFWQKVNFHRWRAHQFLWVDETSKDLRALRRTFGYALRGSSPVGTSGLGSRGERVSALASFDVNGFVAWDLNDGTYNRDAFLTAAERVIVRAGAGRRAMLLRRRETHPQLCRRSLVPCSVLAVCTGQCIPRSALHCRP